MLQQRVFGRPFPDPAFSTFDSDADDDGNPLPPLLNCEDLESRHVSDDVLVYKLCKTLYRRKMLARNASCQAEHDDLLSDVNETRERIARHRKRGT